MKGTICSGNKLNSEAGALIYKQGGNAFDACLAAVFTSFFSEPMLTTANGGGVAVIKEKGKEKCIDMGANYPGLERKTKEKPIKSITDYGGTKQLFCLGYPSIAVGGVLEGLVYTHEKYCSLPLKKILEPAVKHGKNGLVLSKFQAYVDQIISSMCTYTPETRAIYCRNEKLIKEGEIIYNKQLAEFLERLGENTEKGMKEYREKSIETVKDKPCSLARKDVEGYEVRERDALTVSYKGYKIHTSTPPSSGGILMAYSLKELEKQGLEGLEHNGVEHISKLAGAMKKSDEQRTEEFHRNLIHNPKFAGSFLGGTTHTSVIDEQGDCMGITTSNGQGAGVIIGDTGIMYNNYLGEEDLMEYENVYTPGERITTMVTPTFISKDNELIAVMGSGGSKRIRSAVLQVVVNLIDFELPVEKAVNEARVHFDEEGILQLEYGIRENVIEELKKKYKINAWKNKHLYFGGVHTATPSGGAGDNRREGALVVV